MKKMLIFVSIILSCTTYSHAWNPPDFTFGLTSDTRSVAISTNTSNSTQILTRDSYVQRTWVINSSSQTIFISSVSTGISFSTSFGIPGTPSSTTPVIWSPDGVNSPYNGSLFAVAQGTNMPTISIYRTK